MPANLENSVVAPGLEKVSFHSNPKERQCLLVGSLISFSNLRFLAMYCEYVNPLQCSCLGNPRDRGAWWAAIYGVAQSRTRVTWLSLA